MTRKWVMAGLLVAAMIGTAVGVRQLVAKDEQKGERADEPKKIVDEIIAKLKAEDLKGMMEVIRTTNYQVWSDEERKFADNAPASDPKVAAAMFQPLLEKAPGKFTGEVELIGKETLGTGCVRYLILQRFERGGMIWKLAFLRTPRGWYQFDLGWDTNILNYLKPVTP